MRAKSSKQRCPALCIKRDLVGIVCTIHIVHNCLQHAVDTLPVCVESLVVKIYKFFHIYTVRVSEPGPT